MFVISTMVSDITWAFGNLKSHNNIYLFLFSFLGIDGGGLVLTFIFINFGICYLLGQLLLLNPMSHTVVVI